MTVHHACHEAALPVSEMLTGSDPYAAPMSMRAWLLTIAVALATGWLLAQHVNILVAGLGSFWAGCLAALHGVAKSEVRAAEQGNRSEPAE